MANTNLPPIIVKHFSTGIASSGKHYINLLFIIVTFDYLVILITLFFYKEGGVVIITGCNKCGCGQIHVLMSQSCLLDMIRYNKEYGAGHFLPSTREQRIK